ncbi:MAG: sugar ABC transporter permease [Armatimonadetes bacterium]|nr:sugar ABC transporter permease [Armatimonadota bacterium]
MAQAREEGGEIPERTLAGLMIGPTLLLIGMIALYPIFSAVWLSFHQIQLQFPELGQPFVGLDNYLKLAGDGRFIHSVWVTFFFSIVTVTFELILGMVLALILNKEFFGRGAVRSAVLVPWAFTTVVSALMWQFIYDYQFGILNWTLQSMGMEPRDWLGSTQLGLVSVIIADVWKTTPFMALLILAGMQTISSDVYEAGRIDGAGPVGAFFRITLPLLKPTILVALLFRMLDAFRIFDLIFVLTSGGPGNSTESLSFLTYIKLFREFDFGMGSALSVVTFLCVLFISFIFIKVLGAKTSQ